MNNSKLKESNIKWLGKIPDNWKTIKFNALYDLRNEKVSDKDFPPLSVTKMGIVPQLSNAAKTNNGDNRKLVEIGDFAINSRSDRRGSCGISKCEGSVSLINTVLKPINREMNPRYYGWLFKTVEFADEFYKWGHGIVDDLWTTNWQDMKNITLVCPSKTEQNKIADFLDKKVLQIDDISKKIQQEITDLEEYRRSLIIQAVTKGLDKNINVKHTEIPYLNNINRNWFITKIGYICTKLQRPIITNAMPLVCSNHGHVIPRPKTMVGKMVSEDNAMQGIKKGDIAIHGMDTWHGAIALSHLNGKITRVVHVCESSQDNRFIVYYLQALAYLGVYKLISYGVRGNTSDFRSWEKVKNIYIPIPTKKEQLIICNYLDKKSNNIESIIQKKQKLLNYLDKYKQSIIYEYVTGKKQVSSKESAKA